MGSTTALFIRGIGQNDSLQTFEQGVATYVDGVPYPRMQGLFLQLFDVSSIEVLRGPQGTLFGKNAVGGAVNITLKSPGEEAEAEIQAQYGRADHKQLNAFIAGPLSDTLGAGASLIYSNHDGYYQDINTDKSYASDDSLVGRIKMVFTPSKALKITLAADVTDMTLGLPAQRAEDTVFRTDVITGVEAVWPAPVSDFDGDLSLSLAEDAVETFTQKGLATTVEWQLSPQWDFKNILAYKEMTSTIWWDLDGTPFVLADIEASWDQDQLSEEMQFHYSGDKLDAVLGLFSMQENSNGAQRSYLNELVTIGGVPLDLNQPGDDRHETRSLAAYGHFTYPLTEAVKAEVGLRWSQDQKSFQRNSAQEIGGVQTALFVFEGKDKWQNLTPSFAITYKPTKITTFYGRIAKGFRSGGFNGRLSSAGDAAPYKPETVWSFETGLKTSFGPMRLNFAAFRNEYTNFQTRISRYADITDPTAGFNFPTVNAGSLKIFGLEGDMTGTWGPLSLVVTAGYLDSEYEVFTDDSGDRSGNKPVFSPKFSSGVTVGYRLDLGQSGTLNLTGSAHYRSGYYLSVENTEALYQPAFAKINLGAQWTSIDDFFIRASLLNVTNELVMQGGLEFRTLGNIQTGYYGTPRTWHIAVGKSF